jgi:predicted small secreted protein
MKRTALLVAFLLLTGPFHRAATVSGARADVPSGGQENPPRDIQQPKYDYMSTFLSRSTQPLGLKDAPEVRALLEQTSAKWAVRATARHILD